MEDYKELYILGQPIKTELGNLHFFKVKDYALLNKYVGFLNLEKTDIAEHLLKYSDNKSDVLNEFKKFDLLQLIHGLSDVLDLHTAYKELFEYCFKEDVFHLIKTDEELTFYKNLIRDMNCVVYEVKNPNPEIEYFNQLKKLYSKKKNENSQITFESLYTSVWLYLGYEPCDITIYQLHALFNRIAQFKNYETTILYSTVAEKVNIEQWYKHISVNKEEEKTTLDEFSGYANSVVGERK